jgi:hypothetical protein
VKSKACLGEGDEGEGKVVGVERAGEGVAGEKRLSASERSCMRASFAQDERLQPT